MHFKTFKSDSISLFEEKKLQDCMLPEVIIYGDVSHLIMIILKKKILTAEN